METHVPPVVAVINTSIDTVELLRHVLERAGFTVVTAMVPDFRDGRLDLEAFLRQHDPAVIVWDIAIPYEAHWRFFQHIRKSKPCRRCQFVLTTPNAARVAKLAGPQQLVHEIVGKPYDLGEVVKAVKEAALFRPVS